MRVSNMDLRRRSTADVGYRILGDVRGPDIVLLHGWGCDRRFLEPQLTCFSETSRVIAPDFPGFGCSAPMVEPTITRVSRSIIALLDEIGTTEAIVVGHSMGGIVGLELARLAPRIVSRLAMLDTVLWPSPEFVAAISNTSRMLHDGRYEEALSATKAALFMPQDSASVMDLFESSYKAADPGSLVASFDAHLIDYDVGPAIAELHCPAAYIGTDAAFVSFETLRSKIGGIKIGKVIGSGHFAPLLVPKQVNALVAGFLSVTA